MFTDSLIDNNLLLLLVPFVLMGFWSVLGRKADARLFICLNFSIIFFWLFLEPSFQLLRAEVALFMLALLIFYRFPLVSAKRLPHRAVDAILDFESVWLVLILSSLSLVVNLSSGLHSITDLEIRLQQNTESAGNRYLSYLVLANGWMVTHMITRASTRLCWRWPHFTALTISIFSSAMSLSKASFLPLILTLIFANSHRLSWKYIIIILGISGSITYVIASGIIEAYGVDPLPYLFNRIIKNVDCLDYITILGPHAYDYPHASFFYPIWPIFQFTQKNFVVPGIWLMGESFGNWSGIGPNPTFIVDLILTAKGSGLALAPLFGTVLRLADGSRYRVFLTFSLYSFLQDWYLSWLSFSLFAGLGLLMIFLRGRRSRSCRQGLLHSGSPCGTSGLLEPK